MSPHDLATLMTAVDDAVRGLVDAQETATGLGMTVLKVALQLLETDGGAAAAAGTAVAAGGWTGWRIARRLLPVAAALYARIRKLDLTKHPARARLLATIQEERGATTRDLVARTGLKKSTALHHLRTLERGGLVRSRRLGRDRGWYDAAEARADPSILTALHAPTRQRIVGLAAIRPGITQAELARELGFARATVHHHVAALRSAGLIEIRRAGLRKGCFPLATAPP